MKTTKLTAAAIALVATVSIVPSLACSRVLVDTPHGESIVRTLDWDKNLGTVARVHPVGEQRKTHEVSEYKNAATWTVKYQTLALEEHDVFHGTTAEAVNLKGLSSSVLYMADSKPYIAEHEDTGAPAVNFADIATYIAENYATVQEAKAAIESGSFQIAWNSALPGAGKHGLHVSVQDKSGDVILVQINKGGKVVVHHGEEDLRVMANSPLQQHHRAYVAQYDMANTDTAKKIPASISSKDRNLRLIWNFSNQKNWDGLSWKQTEGKLQSTFDASALVPQEVIDPETGATYTTRIQYVYNLETGSMKLRNLETYSEITFNINDIATMKKPMVADLAAQSVDQDSPVWKEVNP